MDLVDDTSASKTAAHRTADGDRTGMDQPECSLPCHVYALCRHLEVIIQCLIDILRQILDNLQFGSQ